MFPVAVQEKDGTAQSIGLPFHEKNKAREDFGKRSVRRDHFQNSALIEEEKLFFFDFRDVATNDHPACQLAIGTS